MECHAKFTGGTFSLHKIHKKIGKLSSFTSKYGGGFKKMIDERKINIFLGIFVSFKRLSTMIYDVREVIVNVYFSFSLILYDEKIVLVTRNSINIFLNY